MSGLLEQLVTASRGFDRALSESGTRVRSAEMPDRRSGSGSGSGLRPGLDQRSRGMRSVGPPEQDQGRVVVSVHGPARDVVEHALADVVDRVLAMALDHR